MMRKILVVEDNVINMLTINAFLKEEFIINFAKNGIRAIELSEENDFDIILMDLKLGTKPDGFTVTKQLRKMSKYKKTPIIAVTVYRIEQIKGKLLESGFSDYLAKPFSKGDIKSMINKYC